MALSSDLVSQFIKTTNDKPKASKEETVYGTVVEGGVKLDGSEMVTPMTTYANMQLGDRVRVSIKNHTAYVVGNASSPAARIQDVDDVNTKVDENTNNIKQVNNDITQINNVITEQENNIELINNDLLAKGNTINLINNTLTAHNSRIEIVESTIETHNSAIETINSTISTQGSKINTIDSAVKTQASTIETINSAISTQGSKIDTIDSTVKTQGSSIETLNSSVNILNSSFQIQNGVVTGIKGIDTEWITTEQLEADSAKIIYLTGEVADFKTVTTDLLDAHTASIDDLYANKLSATDADIKYANIDFSNIGKAAMEYFYANSGLIKNVVVGDQTLTGELVGVTIKGDLIEGNTIIADKLVIKGEDGLYYKLNTDGITTEAEQTDYNSLNGQVICARSITATKIAVEDLVAFGATIGGFKITDNSIYSGVKESVDNGTRGIYLDNTGQIAFGDGHSYIKYYKDTDGTYKLAISAEQITMGGSSTNISDEISAAQTTANNAQLNIDSANARIDTLVTRTDSLGQSLTSVTQTADKINWLVKSGTSSSDFTLTDRTATLITNSLVIKDSTGESTIISGGKMDIKQIFAQDITATGKIRSVELIGATGSFTGNVTANTLTCSSGTIGGWNINSGGISKVTGTKGVYVLNGTNSGNDYLVVNELNSDGSWKSTPFYVRSTGQMYAANATIKGSITATSGKIGSFNINNSLYTNSNTLVYRGSDSNVYLGSDGIGFGNSYLSSGGGMSLRSYDGTTAQLEGGSLYLFTNDGTDIPYLEAVAANTKANSGLHLYCPADFDSTLSISGAVTCKSNLTVNKSAAFNSTIDCDSSITAYKRVYVEALGRKIGLAAQDGDKVGLYDYTNSKWLIYSESDGGIPIRIPTKLSVGGYINPDYGISCSSFICDGWLRTKNDTGWYSEDYGGGIYMNDTVSVKVFNNKSFYCNNEIRAGLGGSGQFRAVGGNYGFFIRNDGANTYFMLTDSGDQWGGWNDLRPLIISNSTGKVTIGTATLFNSDISSNGNINAATVSTYSGNHKPIGSIDTDGQRVSGFGGSSTTVLKAYSQWGKAGASYSAKNIAVSSSDIRLKRNILNTNVNALNMINSIKVRQFDWIDNPRHQTIGFVADELEELDPLFSLGGGYDEDGNMDVKGVDTFYMMGYVVKGIQEICSADNERDEKIQSNEARVDSLQTQLNEAMNQIAELKKLVELLTA